MRRWTLLRIGLLILDGGFDGFDDGDLTYVGYYGGRYEDL